MYIDLCKSAEARKIVQAAFPDFSGRRARIDTAEFKDVRSYWSDGCKSYFVFVRLDTLQHTAPVPAQSAFDPKIEGAERCPIPEGVACVEHRFSGMNEYMTIWIHPSNMNPKLIPATPELSWAEKVVLCATRSLKNTYGGRTNLRFTESQEQTSITQAEWDVAVASLKEQKLLDSRGALTIEGRNAASGLGQLFGLKRPE